MRDPREFKQIFWEHAAAERLGRLRVSTMLSAGVATKRHRVNKIRRARD